MTEVFVFSDLLYKAVIFEFAIEPNSQASRQAMLEGKYEIIEHASDHFILNIAGLRYRADAKPTVATDLILEEGNVKGVNRKRYILHELI